MTAQAADVLEALAAATWNRRELGWMLECAQGEETITDINLLDIELADCPQVRVKKTPKSMEKLQGTDWEWWIQSRVGGWCRYAVQAKRLSRSGVYRLRHKIGKRFQIDVLEDYARVNSAIPLYCFYNSWRGADGSHWHCPLPFQQKQLGCSIAPLGVVRNAFEKGAPKTFSALHTAKTVRPWRCFVTCPETACAADSGLPPGEAGDFRGWYLALPEALHAPLEDRGIELPPDLYNPDAGYPRWIVIISRDFATEAT